MLAAAGRPPGQFEPSFVRPTSMPTFNSLRLNFHSVSYGLQLKKSNQNCLKRILQTQPFRSEAKPWYSPMFSWQCHSFGGWKLSNHHSYRAVAVAACFSRCTGLARAPKGADIGAGHSCFELAARSLNLILVQDFIVLQYLNKEPGSLCCLCTLD